ncbi:translocation/assembly module TamB domain-containing protein [Litchfieldella xinjiangensis]|uniref:autotransporter assembly complex protein TamB n=1 Tax=Litchfieldella xinjiangensis TaxID=1166948 RepID=UPI0006938EBA|nr:translocation/assembly module TamB domain-containing protein [Halomonas xinjiangensis]
MRILSFAWTLLRGVIWLPIWVLGLVLFALGLALSPWGTGLLLEQGQQRGWFSYEHAEGAPLDRLVLDEFRLQAGPADIYLRHFILDWADDCILSGKLCIDELTLAGGRVSLEGGEAQEQESPNEPGDSPFSFSFPFPVEVRRAIVDDMDVRLADGTHLAWDRFITGVHARGDTVTLAPTVWHEARLTLPVSAGSMLALDAGEADQPTPIQADAIDSAIAGQSPLPAVALEQIEEEVSVPLEEQARLSLPDITLPVGVEVPHLLISDFAVEGPFEYTVDRLSLMLAARDSHVQIMHLALASVEADAELSAQIELSGDYPLEAELNTTLWLPERFPELSGESLTLNVNGSLADLDFQLEAQGPVDLRLDGQLDALDPTLPFLVTLRSDEARWPLPSGQDDDRDAGEAGEQGESPEDTPYRIRNLLARLEGDLLDYRAALSVEASGPQIPSTRLALTGEGDHEHFAWSPLSLALEQGSLISHGDIDWSDGLQVNTDLRLSQVDPGQFTEALSGQISGTAEVRFAQGPGGWQLDVPDVSLDGRLQDLPMRLDASLAGNSDMHWQIERLDFRQGENRLNAQGRLGERLSLSGSVDVPALEALSPELAGSLQGEFDVRGTLESPQVEVELLGEQLRFADNRVERLNLSATSRGFDDPQLDAQVDIEQVDAAGQRFDTIDLDLSGRLSDHRLTVEADASEDMPLSRLSLALSGGLNSDRSRYRGRVSPLEIDSDDYGELRLSSPVDFTANLNASSVDVEPFCLRREQGGELCIEEPLQAGATQGSAVFALNDMPMDLVNNALPEGWQIQGGSDADVVARWEQGGTRWSVQTQLDSQVVLSGQDAYGQPWQLPASQASLTVDANQARAEAELSLTLAESGELRLDLGIDDPMNRGALEGRLVLDDIRLSPYRSLVAGMERLRGGISGDVAIGGDLTSPSLTGDIRLNGLQARGGDIPVEIRDGEIGIELAGDQATIQGFIAAEQGRLNIDGEAAWPSTDAWEISLDLEARDDPILAVLPDFGRLRIAPDLEIDIDPELLQVRGRVEIPWARLEVGQTPPSAVSPSSDEIIITRRDEIEAQREAERATEAAQEGADVAAAEALAEAGMEIDVRIDLVLGSDILLEAYGLETGLSGTLEVRQQSGPVQLFGDVNLTDGRFRAFGQDLLIRQGQLLFSGPADQPLLQFEAIRNPNVTEDDVIAGLRVSGSADAPNLEVFSEPAMDEARALSYLLRGRAPEDGDTDGALASALIGLSLSRTGNAVGQLGEAFGIDDLSLETAGTGEESQVVVSGYLFEDLRVSYGVGIFSPIAELTLRYTLMRNLYLQAVSGAAQAVDLIYSFSLGKAASRP